MEIVSLDRSLRSLAWYEKKECDPEGGYLFIFKRWPTLVGKELVEREEFEDSDSGQVKG